METKNIIALSASPSKGWNSDTMLNAFIEGALTVRNIEVKKMYTVDIPCDDYSFATRTGAHEHEHELQELLQAIDAAQGCVVATPTYNFGVPAGLKNIIDRMRPIALDMRKMNLVRQPTGKLNHLKTFFLVSGGTPLLMQKMLFFIFPPFWLSVIFKYYGARLRGSIYGGSLKATSTAAMNVRLLKKARRAGARFAKKL